MSPNWYAFVKGRPNPEREEQANIALIIGNGAARDLVYIGGLPRLAGIASADLRAAMEEVLKAARSEILEESDRGPLVWLEPQIQVGDPVPLYVEPTREVIETLTSVYLRGPLTRAQPERLLLKDEDEPDPLARLIPGMVAAAGAALVADATPKRLYGDDAEGLFAVSLPPVSWAVRAHRRDWLLDSVTLAPNKLEVAVRRATAKIDRAFWHYAEAKERIRRRVGSDVRPVGVIFSGTNGSPEIDDAREFIEHNWRRHALVVHGDNAAEIVELRRQMASP